VKVKSRYTIIGIILALALSIVAIVPAMAGTRSAVVGTVTLQLDVLDAAGGTIQSTLVAPSTLYVSNKAAAYDAVLVTVTDTSNSDGTTGTTATVTVKNIPLNASIAGTTLTLTELTDGVFTGTFLVDAVGTATSPTAAVRATADGQTIRVTTGSGVTAVTLDLTVDGTGPTITSLSPVNSVVQNSVSASFSGQIDDATAGLQAVSGQPVLVAGVPKEIVINIGGTNKAGNADYTASGKGFTYLITSSLAAGANLWYVTAKDRVGNLTETDAVVSTTTKPSTTAADRFTLTVDTTKPGIGKAEAGIGWNAVTKVDKQDRSSIKLTFTGAGVVGTTPVDNLDTATVGAGDFNVVGSTVSGVIHPNLSSPATKNIVYLTLASPLGATAKPKVQLLSSALTDVAGNLNTPQDITSVDMIKPALTVTVAGDSAVTGRPAAKGTAATSTVAASVITITVVSDEALTAAPTVNLNTLTYNSGLKVLAVNAVTATAVSGSTYTWTSTGLLSSLSNASKQLISVHVTGIDASGNSNTTTVGSGATVGATVNLTLATIFEFDNNLTAATLTLTPNTSSTVTESANPFIRIDFSEGKEYNINSVDALSFGTPAVSVQIDSHNLVTLTALLLDDVSVLGTQGSVDSDSFVLKASGLSVGTHTLKFNGTDDVGNTFSANQTFTFTVSARVPYSVSLSPGWNLISLPGDPSDMAIDTVLPSTHPATSVLSYDTSTGVGQWLVASRADDGTWTGTLSTIDSKHAYWVSTTAFTPISTLIPERDPAAVLPTIAVKAGWNLLPVVDLQIKPAGGGPGGVTTSAANYFTSITWSVGYSFDTQNNTWSKLTASSGNVVNGKGYWVWATKDATLVP